ncbi:acetate and sugar kinases/Hsc70/actin family protein [[Clostridium] colinum]|uniref:molecular chaperone n=1 Tax=[Clostridium] colinum TaxID=36835 RepID=UPI0020256A61|nr:molecular chaperone [[Clostridium] colinum]
MGKGYIFNPNIENKELNKYYKEDLELMTLYKLREICKKEKIISGVINPLDKEELIRLILRYRGGYKGLLIKNENVEGIEKLETLIKNTNQFYENNLLNYNSKIVVYENLATKFYDNITLKYNPLFINTNAIVISENKICGIFNVEQKGNDKDKLYLTKSNKIQCRESKTKNYKILFMGKDTSEKVYKIYNGELSEKLQVKFYCMPLLSFEVKSPLKVSMPLAIDFGTVNTTIGLYLNENYFEERECNLNKNNVNYVKFYDIQNNYKEMPIYPTIIAIDSLEDDKVKYLFGFEAEKLVNASYIDESFCIFYDVKRWISDYEKEEEVYDKNGKRSFIKRKDMLKAYFEYLIEEAKNYFKIDIEEIHISSPVKQKNLFNKLFKEILDEKILSSEESIDEGMAVLYSIVSEMIRQNKYEDLKEYKALIIDCGGGTTDICSCKFSIEDIKVSYKIDIKTSYENGDTNFGGNNLTYRIMQILKICIVNSLNSNVCMNFSDILNSFDLDIFRFVDKNGVKKFYELIEIEYEKAEKVLPTKFKNFENLSKEEYYKVRHNFYYLYTVAERLKKLFYNKIGTLKVLASCNESEIIDKNTELLLLEKWKLSKFTQKGLETIKEISNINFNVFEIEVILKADIYNIISKFMNTVLSKNKFTDFSVIKLTGQSCKIELFRDSLKEFIPGKYIQFKRTDRDLTNNFELKMTCIDGCVKYLYDKRYGLVKINMETEVPSLPYKITGYTHKNEEITLIKAFDKECNVGMLSRNITDLTLKLYLKDIEDNEKYSYIIQFKKQDFRYIQKEDIIEETKGKITQRLTDDIIEYEVRFFVWSIPEDIGFKVLPIYRENENLYIGIEKFVSYENENWINNFFDGLK